MSRKSQTMFFVNVPVTRKMLARAAVTSTFDLEGYELGVTRAGGVNRQRIQDALIEDEAFRTEISKQMANVAQDAISFAIDYSDIDHAEHPMIKAAVAACEVAYAKRDETRDEREKAGRIKEARALLTEAGYRVTKG
jgi:hypothetical protein